MRRSALKRGSGLKRRWPKQRVGINYTARDFHEAARLQGVCAVTARHSAWHAHHVVEAQHVVREGGDRYDPRNALRLTVRAHEQHTSAMRRLRAQELRDENIAYAFELLGRAAYPYLMRMYDGSDDRIELAIAELER